MNNFYAGAPTTYHHYHYGDHFSPMLTGYLIGRLSSPAYHTESVRYIYNHWDEMDQARRDQLLRENANLRAELAAMSGPRDPGFRMAGVEEDLLYSDAAVAPEGSGPWVVLGWLIGLGVAAALIWAIFVKDWS